MPQNGAPSPVLNVTGLSVTLHRDGRAHAILDRISLTVRRGEIVAMLGESGSGKSTLALAAMGLLPADAEPEVSGSVAIDGIELLGGDALRWRTVRRERLGAVFQDPIGSLNPSIRIGGKLAEAISDGKPPAAGLGRGEI